MLKYGKQGIEYDTVSWYQSYSTCLPLEQNNEDKMLEKKLDTKNRPLFSRKFILCVSHNKLCFGRKPWWRLYGKKF